MMINEQQLHEAFTKTFSTDEGKIVLEFLRIHCFMKPLAKTPDFTGQSAQMEFRMGRMTLFQMIEFQLQEREIDKPAKAKRKGVFSNE